METAMEEMRAGRESLIGGRPNIIITKARRAKIWDVEGKEYIHCTLEVW